MDINYYKKFEPIDGKWYISKEIGSGAFGTVFEIERKDFADMKAALKVVSIPSSQSEVDSYKEENYDLDEKSVTSYFYGFVEEFVKEFRLMSQLKGHSNIVSYEDHDVKQREDGIGWDIFIRMELLTPMNKYFANNAPKKSDIIKLGVDICKALEVCQKYNIIHRDIKPSNIFVSSTGDFKLGDFGVARTLEKTSSGLSKKGTYTYMAPEVFKGEKYGSNVDIYSLGIVMYKLLNNNLEPFRTDRTYNNGEKAMEQRMSGVAIPMPANAEGRLAEIVLKACSFDPNERYESPIQMREELESILYNEAEGKVIFPNGDGVNYEPSFSETDKNIPDETQNDEKTASMFSNSASGTSYLKDEPAHETEETVSQTVGMFGNVVADKVTEINTEQEVVKAAFAHSPEDFNSAAGRTEIGNAWTKIIPNYSSVIRLSANLTTNSPDEIKARISNVDTDSLLVAIKSLAYYMGNGDDKNILGPVQKFIINTLKTRPLGATVSEPSIEDKGAIENKEKIATKEPVIEKPKKENSFMTTLKKKWKLIVPIVAAVALLIAGIIIFSNMGSGSLLSGDYTTYELYPKVEDYDISKMGKVVEARAKALGVKSNVVIEEDKIVLQLQEDFATTSTSKRAILDLIACSGDFSIAKFAPMVESCNDGITNITIETDPKDKFVTYLGEKLKEDSLEKIKELPGENIYYLHLTLDKQTSIKFKECIESDITGEMTAIFDAYKNFTTSGGFYMSWVDGGEVIEVSGSNASELYIIPIKFADEENTVNFLKYMIESDTMENGLNYQCVDEPEWETDTAVMGVNQVADFEGDYIIAEYSDNYGDIITDEEFAEALTVVKARLDVLEVPYSIGYKGVDKRIIALKINPEDIGSDMLRMFTNIEGIDFYTQFDKIYSSLQSFELANDPNGNLSFKADFYDSKDAIKKAVAEKSNGSVDPEAEIPAGTMLYMVANEVTIASADLSTLGDDTVLYFSNLLCMNKNTIDDSDIIFASLVEHIFNEEGGKMHGCSWDEITVKYYKDNEPTDLTYSDIPWKYDNQTEVDKNIKKIVEKHNAQISKSYCARNSIIIELDIKLDDNFAKNFVDEVKAIYTECNFDLGAYAEIDFTIKGAGTKNPTDKALISFYKDVYRNSKVVVQEVVIAGPTFEKYEEDVKAMYETDAFFTERKY